jgi:adenylate cyclase
MGNQAGQTARWPTHIPPSPVHIDGWSDWLKRHPSAELIEPRATFPVPEVATRYALLASVKEVPDDDGTFRRVAPFRVFDNQPVPLLGLAAYLQANGQPPFRLTLAGRSLRVGDSAIPLDARGRTILRFRGKSGTHEALSAAAVIQSELRIAEGAEPVIDPAELNDAVVFIGVSFPGGKDLKTVPVSKDYPGVEVHATLLDNLMSGDFIRPVPFAVAAAATWLWALLAGWVIVRSRGVAAGIVWAAILLLGPLALGFALYIAGWWWPVMTQTVAALVAVGAGSIVHYATEGRQKRFIKSAFRQYLSGEVIERMLDDPSQLKLGGEKRELSIYFSDLQGFSAISETLGPVDLTALLNDYLTDMSDLIMGEGGTVDKYEGDAIIAFWNAPLSQADHAVRAVRAALLCQRKLTERRAEFAARTGVELFMRIGIHTGEVVVGNMGSHTRFNYTVLGDAANLASRLEGANKAFGTYLMVSEFTWNQTGGAFHGRAIGPIMVVGRRAPVQVYEVLGFRDEPEPEGLAAWNRGVVLCREGRWGEAAAAMAEWPHDDALAARYRDQFGALAAKRIEAWDGIWRLSEK